MIKASFACLAILLGIGLCSSDKADASGCGRAEVQAACASSHHVVHLRRGQIRRAERRARRAHRQALRGSCGYAEVNNTCGHTVRVGCAGVAVVAPSVEVHVAAPCCD
jgi:hypothetical protein